MGPPFANVGGGGGPDALLPRLPGGGAVVAPSGATIAHSMGVMSATPAPSNMMTSKLAQTDINMENMEKLVRSAASAGEMFRLVVVVVVVGSGSVTVIVEVCTRR